MNLGAQMGPVSITKLSPNWACQMGPIHCPKFLLPGRLTHSQGTAGACQIRWQKTRRPHPDTLESGPQLGLGCHGRGHPSSIDLANTSTTNKYQELSNTHVFIPLALETLGPTNTTGMDFISDLARDLTRSTGDPSPK